MTKTPNPDAQVCEHTNSENEDRICNTCGAGPISAGYVLNGGCYYYCTIECLRADPDTASPESDISEWLRKADADETDEQDLEYIYYTEWEDDYPEHLDPETATIGEALTRAMDTLEGSDIDALGAVAARIERELTEARASMALAAAALATMRGYINADGGPDYSNLRAHELLEQCDAALKALNHTTDTTTN